MSFTYLTTWLYFILCLSNVSGFFKCFWKASNVKEVRRWRNEYETEPIVYLLIFTFMHVHIYKTVKILIKVYVFP
jgi:hypothetical protein